VRTACAHARGIVACLLGDAQERVGELVGVSFVSVSVGSIMSAPLTTSGK
jgi:hypothetical protein